MLAMIGVIVRRAEERHKQRAAQRYLTTVAPLAAAEGAVQSGSRRSKSGSGAPTAASEPASNSLLTPLTTLAVPNLRRMMRRSAAVVADSASGNAGSVASSSAGSGSGGGAGTSSGASSAVSASSAAAAGRTSALSETAADGAPMSAAAAPVSALSRAEQEKLAQHVVADTAGDAGDERRRKGLEVDAAHTVGGAEVDDDAESLSTPRGDADSVQRRTSGLQALVPPPPPLPHVAAGDGDGASRVLKATDGSGFLPVPDLPSVYMCSLLSDEERDELEQHRLAYAEMLYRWLALEKRAEILSLGGGGGVAAPSVRTLTGIDAGDERGVEFAAVCAQCRTVVDERVAHYGMCHSCKKAAVLCVLCRLPVRGIATFCTGCGHGGHAKHLRQWFSDVAQVCPMPGCGCHCRQNVFALVS